MQEAATCQLKIHKTAMPPTITLSVVCAFLVILARALPSGSLIRVEGIPFAYTDFFAILSGAVGGLGSGILTFVILFIGEFIRIGGDYSLYSVSIYLILVLLSSWLSYIGWFKGALKIGASCGILTGVLVLCWRITFTYLMTGVNAFNVLSLGELILSALPETAAAVASVSAFLRFAPDKWKMSMGSGWAYVRFMRKPEHRWQVMAIRLTTFSMLESLFLCFAAIFCVNYFAALSEGETFTLRYLLLRWRFCLQVGLTMMCTAVPVAFLLNALIMKYIVYPINAMAFLMERYFSVSEQERVRALPDLNIRTGDELEQLYHSLQKMVADMGIHIDQLLEQERKTARLTKEFMLALAKAVDAKDHYTSGHSFRVAKYAKEIARRMGKTPKEQEDIYTMGLLHDIGKIGIPKEILNKNAKLTDEEYRQIREHPVLGQEILKYVEELPALATGARWHHERYDGRGYPDGLAGEEIPEEARIICVADAYDALTSKRSYSGIRPQSEVRAEIARCKGTQFDPAFADIMLQMIDDDKNYKMREWTRERSSESVPAETG